MWRWLDVVVLGLNPDGSVQLWEPAHGEVAARPRPTYELQEPGSRPYASAGLPGAAWWVADTANRSTSANVELAQVDELYTVNGLWGSVSVL